MSTQYANSTSSILSLPDTPKNTVWSKDSGSTVTGTSGSDILRGYDGTYTYVGGTGDDTYILGSAKDTVVEQPGGGIDTVKSYFAYTLAPNVENLVLSGKNAWFGGGNDLNNVIVGDSTDQQIDGGKGNDVLVGGGGADTFIVRAGNGSDVITDFSSNDKVRLIDYGLSSFDQVKSITQQIGKNTVLSFGNGEKLILNDVQATSLAAGNFQLQHDMSGLKQTFGDEFNSLSLLSKGGIWRTEYGYGGVGTVASRTLNSENQIYMEDGFKGNSDHNLGVNPFSIDNGILTITAAPTSADVLPYVDGHTYTSGLLTSKFTFSQEYGYFEIKCAMPEGQGFWPAFWLLPTDNSWPPELDVFEQLGKDPNTIYMTNHFSSPGVKNDQIQDRLHIDTTQMHTYGVDWGPQTLKYYVDGVLVATQPTPASMNKEMFMLMNLAVGGPWAGRPDATTGTGEMKIDYVRAYATDNTVSTTINGVHTVYPQANQAPTQSIPVATTTATPSTSSSAPAPAAAPETYAQVKGTSGIDQLTAAKSMTEIWAFEGNDILNGGPGKAILHGGKGDDLYRISSADQIVQENANEGSDSVHASISYTLTANVENLALTGTANLIGTGNELANRIVGNDGDNVLNGKAGNDILTGGLGADTFVIEAGNGTDTITNFVHGTDHISLQGYGITSFSQLKIQQNGANVRVTLPNGEQVILNGVQASTLDASDFLLGSAAATSTPPVSAAIVAPVVASTPTPAPAPAPTPAAAPSAAPVISSVSDTAFHMTASTANMALDSLTKNVVGNALNNRIIGNALDNVIDGGDGDDQLDGGIAGNDVLIGGKGNDLYIVNHVGTTLVEKAGEGVDSVQSSISFTLGANIENLLLTGTAAINGTGNELANRIIGNSANNIICGMGGNDTLMGGGGSDTFAFSTGFGKDIVTDFGKDDALNFTGLSAAKMHITQVGTNTVIDFGGADSITLQNVLANDPNLKGQMHFY